MSDEPTPADAGEENEPTVTDAPPSEQPAVAASKTSAPRLSRQKKMLFLGILLAGFLVLQEVLLRIIFPVPEVANINRVQYSQMFHGEAQNAGMGKFLANSSYIHASDPDGVEFVHTLNLYGFRDRQWSVAKPADHHRIMFFGDSFMEGAMAPDHQTIPEGFRNRAAEQGTKYDVMNLGIQAMGLTGYMYMMADTVPVFKPDSVVIVFFGNDFHAISPFDSRLEEGRGTIPQYNSIWQPRIAKLVQNLFDGYPNPRRWHSKPFSFFASVPNPRNPLSDRRAFEEYSKFVDANVLDAMMRGRFNPYIIDSFVFDEEEMRRPINVHSYLEAYQNYLAERNIDLYTAFIPINHQVSDHYQQFQMKFSRSRYQGLKSLMTEEYDKHRNTVATLCELFDIPHLDFTPLIREMEAQGRHMYWDYDNHMRGESYVLLGKTLYDWIEQLRSGKTANDSR